MSGGTKPKGSWTPQSGFGTGHMADGHDIWLPHNAQREEKSFRPPGPQDWGAVVVYFDSFRETNTIKQVAKEIASLTHYSIIHTFPRRS